MKYKLSVLVFTFLLSHSAKKLHYPLEAVVGMADLIVIGEIESVSQDSYKFRIDKTVKGEEKSLIKVQMFKEWTCDNRIKKAEKGQKLFLFLIGKDGKYEIINGSTGEMFIEGDKVLRTIKGVKPTVNDLAYSIHSFTIAYKLKSKDYKPFGENIFIQLLSNKEVNVLAKESDLTNWFFDAVKDYKIEN